MWMPLQIRVYTWFKCCLKKNGVFSFPAIKTEPGAANQTSNSFVQALNNFSDFNVINLSTVRLNGRFVRSGSLD